MNKIFIFILIANWMTLTLAHSAVSQGGRQVKLSAMDLVKRLAKAKQDSKKWNIKNSQTLPNMVKKTKVKSAAKKQASKLPQEPIVAKTKKTTEEIEEEDKIKIPEKYGEQVAGLINKSQSALRLCIDHDKKFHTQLLDVELAIAASGAANADIKKIIVDNKKPKKKAEIESDIYQYIEESEQKIAKNTDLPEQEAMQLEKSRQCILGILRNIKFPEHKLTEKIRVAFPININWRRI